MAATETLGPRDGQVDQARRVVELAHLGRMLPLEEEAVRDAFTALLQPYGPPPLLGWREFVTQTGGEAPEINVFKFELGECEITGPNGQPGR